MQLPPTGHHKLSLKQPEPNGEPAVLIHHGIFRRWRCGS